MFFTKLTGRCLLSNDEAIGINLATNFTSLRGSAKLALPFPPPEIIASEGFKASAIVRSSAHLIDHAQIIRSHLQ